MAIQILLNIKLRLSRIYQYSYINVEYIFHLMVNKKLNFYYLEYNKTN